ncbi:hypothetical protein N7G274_008662 [Stereocaulon virgatum]|uniref:GPI inositol-deacylase winged helix domain-containing protein n=1 Tax=Stereocaulon virgatum TaxID=373712 RepID=A0ABR4A1H3_9LECA
MVNIIVTCRPIPTILSEFKLSTHLKIRASRTDIQKYLEAHMGRFSKRIMAENNLQTNIIAGILDAGKGMFLLARLNLDSLVGKTNPKAIKRVLENLPTGSDALDSAYKDVMDRIESQSPNRCNLAKKVLTWITYAKELLSIEELEQAVAIEIGQSDLDQDNVCDYEDIVSVCAGFVIADFNNVRLGGFLRLAHYTTQEYLVRNGMEYFPEAQQIMASNCLTYLLYDAFSETLCNSPRNHAYPWERLCTVKKDVCNLNVVQRHLFYRYAAWHWGYHSAKCR